MHNDKVISHRTIDVTVHVCTSLQDSAAVDDQLKSKTAELTAKVRMYACDLHHQYVQETSKLLLPHPCEQVGLSDWLCLSVCSEH